jgi:hypothetical protein
MLTHVPLARVHMCVMILERLSLLSHLWVPWVLFLKIPIVTAAVAYDDPITYKTFVLFFPQSLYIDNMEHNLLCCEQLQHNQVQINETPLIHIQPEDRHISDHSILVETPTGETLHIPLELDGTTSFFHTRIPTKQELDDDTLAVHVYMTSDMKWDPQSDQHHMHEAAIHSSLTDPPATEKTRTIYAYQTITSPQRICQPRFPMTNGFCDFCQCN